MLSACAAYFFIEKTLKIPKKSEGKNHRKWKNQKQKLKFLSSLIFIFKNFESFWKIQWQKLPKMGDSEAKNRKFLLFNKSANTLV